jgi:hypothetical protein
MDPRETTKADKHMGLPLEVSTYLAKLEADERAHLEALFQTTLSHSQTMDVVDLWEQGELAVSFWILVTTGVNQDEEMKIATALLFWKAFFAQEAARVRCIQSSQRREFACCRSRVGTITCPTLIVGDSPNLEGFISVGPELLFRIASEPGCMHRFLTKLHHLIESGASLREVDEALRSSRLWNTMKLDFGTIRDMIPSAINPSWKRILEGQEVVQQLRVKRSWVPGEFTSLATLVDRNDQQLDSILQTTTRALGSGPGEVLTQEYATGRREVAAALYEAVRCTTRLQYDHEPANPGDPHQEVRLAGQVLRNGIATCLDLALLYAALLERAHVAPALLLVERKNGWHAVGAFFDDGSESMTPTVVTDPKAILEMVRTRSLIPVETTGLSATKGKKKTYTRACEEGASLVTNARPLAVVNVLAARRSGLKPPE